MMMNILTSFLCFPFYSYTHPHHASPPPLYRHLGITKNEEEQFIRLFCVRKIKRLINERVYALSVKIGHQRHKQVQLQQQRVAAYITIAGAWKRYRYDVSSR